MGKVINLRPVLTEKTAITCSQALDIVLTMGCGNQHEDDVIKAIHELFPNAGARGKGFAISTIKGLLRVESRPQRRCRHGGGRITNTPIAQQSGAALVKALYGRQRKTGTP
jgi:hypothetical protein